jgi:hypothetical protein
VTSADAIFGTYRVAGQRRDEAFEGTTGGGIGIRPG